MRLAVLSETKIVHQRYRELVLIGGPLSSCGVWYCNQSSPCGFFHYDDPLNHWDHDLGFRGVSKSLIAVIRIF